MARDFLSKSGGEVSGIIALKRAALDKAQGLETYADFIQFASFDMDLCTYFKGQRDSEDAWRTQILAYRAKQNGVGRYSTSIDLVQNVDGTAYATCPPPRGTYTDDIATFKSMVDYAPQKLTAAKTYHVNALTGSDTADLHNGRGESEEKPFKTLEGAAVWISRNVMTTGDVALQLDSDVSLTNDFYITLPNLNMLTLIGKTAATKLNTGSFGIKHRNGCLNIRELTITSSSNLIFDVEGFYGAFANVILKTGVTFQGICTSSVLTVGWGGQVIIQESSIGGTVTGPRYSVTNGGRILTGGKGVNAIPGTEAGTCDASSIYA